MSEGLRTTAKTTVNDLAKFGIDVSNKTVTRALSRNGLWGHRLKKNLHFYRRGTSEPEWSMLRRKHIILSDATKLDLGCCL